MYDFVRFRKWAFLITAALLVASVALLVAPPRLPLGLEFKSGSSLTVEFLQPVAVDDVRARLEAIGLENPTIQQTGEREFFIRTRFVDEGLLEILQKAFGPVTAIGFEGATDLATTVSFPNPVPAEDLRALFGKDVPQGTIIEALPDGRVLVFGRMLPDERLTPAMQAWRERYGAFERVDFGPADVAVTLRYQNPVALNDVRQELTSKGFQDVLAARLSDTEVLLLARGLAEQDRERLFSTLKDRFGEPERTPMDFSTGKTFTLRFTEAVTFPRFVTELVVLPVSEVVGGQATVRRASSGTILVQGDELTAEQAKTLTDRLQGPLGPLEVNTFAGPDDLATTLNFGPAVTLPEFQAEATSLGLQKLVIEASGATAFSVVGEGLTDQQRNDLFSRLESRFGQALRTPFDGEADLDLVLTFTADVQRQDLLTELNQLGLPQLVVASLGEKRFFVGGKGVPAEQREALLKALQERFGQVASAEFDHANGIAAVLDYGKAVTLGELRRELLAMGARSIVAFPQSGQGTFLLVGKAVPAQQREQVLTSLEETFGLAQRTPFDFSKGQVLTIRPTDADRVAQVVRQRLIVQDLGNQRYFLGGKRLSTAQRDLLFGSLTEAFGRVQQERFDFGTKVAQTLAFENPVSPDALRQALEPHGYTDLTMEQRDEGLFILGPRPLEDQRSKILRALEALAPVDRESVAFDAVDAEIAKRSITNTVWAILAGTVAILLYVWYAFRRVQRPFRYGVAAVLALLHDVVIILGVLALLAKFSNVEFNSLTIVGILAILGFSVNNTIVVFDRVRENIARHPGRSFDDAVNVSLNETITRNLSTTITTVFAILAVILFGGPTVRDFMIVLLVGVLAGLYNSQFLAANLLVAWERGELRLLFWRRRARGAPA